MDKLLVYIVSYNRKSYTIGTIKAIYNILPANSDIFVCDNGSTDGTREWLEENQNKYQLGLLFPENNLRVGGAWTMLTKQLPSTAYDYILLLDNDCWIVPDNTWFEQCLSIFNTDNSIGSLGLQRERRAGYFSMDKTFDNNYLSKKPHSPVLDIYDTVFYAGARLDKFHLWHQTMSKWPYQFIGDKIGREYNGLGYRTIKITPGFIVDISEYNFDNKEHESYNIEFYKRERDIVEYNRRIEMHSTRNIDKEYISNLFGKEFLNYL